MRYQLRYIRVAPLLRHEAGEYPKRRTLPNRVLSAYCSAMSENLVSFAGEIGLGLRDVTTDLSCVEQGKWFLVMPYEGPAQALKFENWRPAPASWGAWPGARGWTSDLDEFAYRDSVVKLQQAIAAGDVYQANLCRKLSAAWPAAECISGLYGLLQKENPAPFSALIDIYDPRISAAYEHELRIASASPELFLQLRDGRLKSAPIKGTAKTSTEFLPKDEAENIMIVDLVRNDLARVCDEVDVEHLLERQSHPGLDHLVSTVSGILRSGCTFLDVLSATFPPGSVTGAPKSSALQLINELESEREFYCGALGVVDGDSGEATLNVSIRTFWKSGDLLRFGTGAGITWESDPNLEWEETELKAAKLISIAEQCA